MPLRTSKAASPLQLSLLWFGIQLAWGAVLGLSLQARLVDLTSPDRAIALYGGVATLGALAAAVVQVVVGPFSDRLRRHGDKRIGFYVAGGGIAALALILFYVAPSFITFVIAFIVLQAAMNVAIGPYQAIIPDFVAKENIGVASGWMAAMQSAGNAIGAIAATLLGNTGALGIVIAAALLLSLFFTVRHIRSVPLQPVAEQVHLKLSMPLVDLFISRALVYLGFYTLLGYFLFYVTRLLPKPYATSPTTAAGVCILIFTLVGAAGAALAAKPADRFDERTIVTAGGGLLAVAVGVLAFLHSLVLVPVVIAIAGIGWGIFLCADWAFACRLLPPGTLASTMAIWNIAIVGPQMLAPLLASVVLAITHAANARGPREAFLLASIQLLLGALWIWRLPKQANGK